MQGNYACQIKYKSMLIYSSILNSSQKKKIYIKYLEMTLNELIGKQAKNYSNEVFFAEKILTKSEKITP